MFNGLKKMINFFKQPFINYKYEVEDNPELFI